MMINPDAFIELLRSHGVTFFTGVPDSLLKNLNNSLIKLCGPNEHTITTNEGSAIGQAIGHYISTNNLAAVYMQNSGLGNAYNPLISLADREIFSIPMLLLIGWRGELCQDKLQISDEPQHKKQGKITLETLEVMEIPYLIIDQFTSNWRVKIEGLIDEAIKDKRPTALVFRKNAFAKTTSFKHMGLELEISRELAIEAIVRSSNPKDVFVSSTGMISRELFEIRKRLNLRNDPDFLCIGGMGHASQIATRIAANTPSRKVLCLDGDGSFLMHTGGLLECALKSNMIYFVLNNGAHESVGGQPTKAFQIDLKKIAEGFGFGSCFVVKTNKELSKVLCSPHEGSVFIEIQCSNGHRDDLGRPDVSPKDSISNLMKFLGVI